MGTTIDLAKPSKVPAYLQKYRSDAGNSMQVGGSNAYQYQIRFKGNRFRFFVNGVEEKVIENNFLDIIIVGATKNVSRIYFDKKYDPDSKEKVRPACYSADGIVPAMDALNRQSATCATCPQNEKGSSSYEGKKSKACSYYKRMIGMLPGDPEKRLWQFDLKGMSIFGESKPGENKFSLKDYGSKLATNNLEPSQLITSLSFDTDSSVPKILFSPKEHVSEKDIAGVYAVVNGEEVKALTKVSAATLSEETPMKIEAPKPVTASKIISADSIDDLLGQLDD